MGKETAMAAKHFWTSFVDGLTGEGIFGDLRLPSSPTRMFRSESEVTKAASLEEAILALLKVEGKVVQAEEVDMLRILVQDAINRAAAGKVEVAVPKVAKAAAERYAVS
jgi:hypothetical protein